MKMTNYYMFFASIIFVGVISINGQTWPLNSNNELSSAFGPRNLGNEDYPGDNYDYDFHPGTDIGGTGDVVAIDWGTVVWKDNLFGNPANPYIAIDYGSAWIQYVHITSTLSEGTDVEAGDVIGQVTDKSSRC